jgi:hypothetical protein
MVKIAITVAHYEQEASFGYVDISGPGKYWVRFSQPIVDGRSPNGVKTTIGAHIFCSQVGNWFYGIIRFSNGLVNKDGTGFIGTVYSNRISVLADANPVNIMIPNNVGPIGTCTTPVVLRPRACWEVPFYFNLNGETRLPSEILASLNCEVNPIIGSNGYGPLNSKQPKVDTRSYSNKYSDINKQLDEVASGRLPLYDSSYGNIAYQYKAVGPFIVEGYSNGYAHGGFGIDTCHGWEGCSEGIGYHARLHRANMNRQFCDALDPATGNPINLYQWTKAPGRDLMKGQPGRQSEVELLCFLEGSYETRKYPIFNKPSTAISYEDSIWEYRPNDVAHIIRVIRHTIPLIEYGGRNPMAMCARFDLEMIAEDSRYQTWSDRSDELIKPSYPGEWLPNTLSRILNDEGGKGHPRLERNFAWMSYLGACMLKYKPRSTEWRTWCNNMLNAYYRHQDTFGFPHREGHPTAFSSGGTGTQIFHMALVGIGVFALSLQTGQSSSRWPINIEKLARLMYMSHEPRKYGYGNDYGPAHWCMTALNDSYLQSPQWIGEGDPAHVLTFMALMARGPSKQEWINRSLKFQIQHSTLQERIAWLQSTVEKSWTAEMQSLIETTETKRS